MYRHGFAALVGALLFLFPLVTAQCSSDEWWNITKPSQVSELVACPTYTGNLDVSALTGTIDLSGVEVINGQLDCDVQDRTGDIMLRSTTLKRVTGSILMVRRVPSLGQDTSQFNTLTVSLPKLDSIHDLFLGWGPGDMRLETGPNLNVTDNLGIWGTLSPTILTEPGLGALSAVGALSVTDLDFYGGSDENSKYTLASPVRQVSYGLLVQECTNLAAVELDRLERVGSSFQVMENPNLDRISSSLTRASMLMVHTNGRNTSLSLPRLETLLRPDTEIEDVNSIRHVAALEMPKLKEVTGAALEIAENHLLSLSLPRLGIADSLALRGNPLLSGAWIPRLTTVGNLTVSGSPAFLNFTANFLRRAESISLSGSFTNVEFFSLEAVTGDFSITGDDSMDCSWFDVHLRDAGVVKGTYSCEGNHTKPAVERKPSTPTTLPELQAWEAGQGIDADGNLIGNDDGGGNGEKEDGPSGLTTGAKAGIGVGVALGVLALAVVAWFLLRRHVNAKADSGDPFRKAELDGGETQVPLPYPQELVVEDKPVEIGADLPVELPAAFPTAALTPRAELMSAEEMAQPAELVSPELPRQPRPTRQATLDDLVSPV